jgi:hypothetical protein
MKQKKPQSQPSPADASKLFKHSPAPDPDQAVESGDPTLTGDETEQTAHPNVVPEPDEGAHWESGQR